MVKTERKVLYILENPSINSEEHDGAKQQRRWRVYFDNLEYTSADFVVISGKWSYILFICAFMWSEVMVHLQDLFRNKRSITVFVQLEF